MLLFIVLIIILLAADIFYTKKIKGKIIYSILRSILLYPLMLFIIKIAVDVWIFEPKTLFQNGKYGFKSKLNVLVPAQYKSLDTLNGVFTYKIEYGAHGHIINPEWNKIYIAGTPADRFDVFVLEYNGRGFRKKLFKLVENSDSLSFYTDTVYYSLPGAEKREGFPVNMIKYYKENQEYTVSYQGKNELPRLKKSPWIRFQNALFVDTDPY